MPLATKTFVSRRLREIRTAIEEQLSSQGEFQIKGKDAAGEIAHLSTIVARSDIASVWLVDDEAQLLRLEASYGSSMPRRQPASLRLGESVQGLVWQSGKEASIEDILMDSRFSDRVLVNEGVRSLLAVPLFADGSVQGILSTGRRAVKPFSHADIESFLALAGVVSDLAWPGEEGQRGGLKPAGAVKYPARLPHGEKQAAAPRAALEEIADDLMPYLAASAIVIWVNSRCWQHCVVRTEAPEAQSADECRGWVSEALYSPSCQGDDAGQGPCATCGGTKANGRSATTVPSIMLPLGPGRSPLGLLAVFRGRENPALEKWQLALAESAADKAGLVVGNFELSCSLGETTRKLEQIRTHKEQFLPAIGHNLRTPLTSIKGFAQLLMRESGEDASRLSQFDTIVSESNRLSVVVDEIVTLDRMEARIASMEIETVSLIRLLQETEDLLKGNSALNQRLESGFPEADVLVRAAHKEMPRVIVGIVRALVSLARENSPIMLSASTRGGQPEIAISVFTNRTDKRGVDEMLKRPYDETRSGDNAVCKTSHDLYVARNIVEAQGGTLKSRWRRAGELLMSITLPTIEKSRGRR